jgi:basic membrane protein A and related proteins
MVVDLPNVQSIVFKEHEGSYLVGILAGMASKSGKVGFVGGMDIPLIRKFACGYAGRQGRKARSPRLPEHDRHTGAAWNDPVKGGEITKGQIDQGADVIYARRRRHGPRRAAGRGRRRQAVDRRRRQPELPASRARC